MTIVAPAITSLTKSNGFSAALSQIGGKFEEARTYAMANNTYVFIGIGEFDASKGESASPQTLATQASGGRIAMAAYASKDGTRIYDTYALSSWTLNYANGIALTPLGKAASFENLHLIDFGQPPISGSMARPAASEDYRIASTECTSSTPLAYPPGARLEAGYKYYFSKVVEFDPQGTARIISEKNGHATPKVIEIGLQPTHRNAIPPAPTDQNTGNHAAIQINAVTGSIKIYRP